MIVRCTLAALALVLTGAAHKPAPARHAHVAPKTIAVFINETPLSIDPPPRYVRGRLLVPVRRILDALGLPFDRAGGSITTQVSDRTIKLRPGSERAYVNGEPFLLESAPVEIKGVLYAPLQFFTRGLGAQARFDPQTRKVQIISQLVGQSTSVTTGDGGSKEYQGVVEAVDNDSQPPSVTVAYGASVKTISIPEQTRVVINDVVANTTVPGSLSDVHVGDYAKILARKNGSIDHLVDAFASRHGSIVAMTGNTIVLSDGHVIAPTGVTTLSLNGDGAKIADLQVGDDLTVRYNLLTSEVRELIATRRGSGAVAAGSVSITSIEPSVTHPLRQGESFDAVMHATPGGQATYDVGPYFSGLPMAETSAGVYSARYTIPRGANFSAAPLVGHLTVHGTAAPRAVSTTEIAASNTPPGIGDFAPDSGQTVNNNQPSIYATFAANAVPVNTSSIVLIINGHDVTASATRTSTFIEYHPMLTYPDGPVHVSVRVSDLAGNTSTKSWTFQIHTH